MDANIPVKNPMRSRQFDEIKEERGMLHLGSALATSEDHTTFIKRSVAPIPCRLDALVAQAAFPVNIRARISPSHAAGRARAGLSEVAPLLPTVVLVLLDDAQDVVR